MKFEPPQDEIPTRMASAQGTSNEYQWRWCCECGCINHEVDETVMPECEGCGRSSDCTKEHNNG